MEEARVKATTSPKICCHTTLQKVSVRLYSFTANLIQIKFMQRQLTTVNMIIPGLYVSAEINCICKRS